MEQFIYYLGFPFVRNAILVGVLIALSSSLLGVILVLKRFSYIGNSLSHVAFGSFSIAMILGISQDMILVMPVTITVAILLLRTGRSKIKGDASLAMISVGSLAIGYLLINIFSESTNISADVCSTLFGSTSILTLSNLDVTVSIIMSIAVIAMFFILYNKIFSVTFDENFAKVTGTNVNAYNTLISVVTAVIIVLAMNLVGSLLITALIIFPALSAMRVCASFKGVILTSMIISIVGALIGMIISIMASTPVGSTIVAVDLIIFLICVLLGKFIGGRK